MSQTKQILLAFLIPFILCISLAFLENYFFPKCFYSAEIQRGTVCIDNYEAFSLIEIAYGFLTIGLFLASLILPPFLTRRAYQSKLSKLKMKSIIE
jgi:hypothetical protein